MDPLFFATPAEFRAWLEKHHGTETELWVGFYKKSSGKIGITYKEAVEEALCFGWIDGISKGVDNVCHKQRFTPRKKSSIWSLANIENVKRLTKEGRMHPAGIKAFEARDAKKTGVYSFENKDKAVLPAADEKKFKANTKAWDFFQSQATWYKRSAIWLVISAKREETRVKRLQELIECSAKGKTIKALTRTAK
jgi:uncharacterized protein YdeI (YjbR/CyaY-like superfamily)